jgi:hypothetical protein
MTATGFEHPNGHSDEVTGVGRVFEPQRFEVAAYGHSCGHSPS